ncbi:GNAT family N-acetyltransferase [Cognatilysobacter lacus]|uniref:N-acetyltransferase family protein n=1 Tax=Cognatilysobacter lacus TaxID=1643323 RepID=A0A5D8Z9R6_9GAMM|nr:GNAT family N-acetyltransferase [Lysobacter lacus]TZF91380.1 N-acetyltransferase family protein [Lysobacter lacus]
MATCSSAIAIDAPPSIRPATEADLTALSRIYADEVRGGTSSYEYTPPDDAEFARRFRALKVAGYPFLVAEAGGRAAGFAYASAYRSREGYRWTVEDSVYIDADHRGRGVGRALLAALITECEALGYRRMVAVIGDATNGASLALHERQGFHVAARFPGLGFKHGRWLENVHMMRVLGSDGDAPPDAPPLPAGA